MALSRIEQGRRVIASDERRCVHVHHNAVYVLYTQRDKISTAVLWWLDLDLSKVQTTQR
jgi:hypothetical protein